MSSTNKTTHYDLSQYVGTDKPTYLSDYNSDMAKIDAALYQANTNASSAESNASTALTQAGQALEKANTNEDDITDLESVTDLLKTNVTTLNSFSNNVQTSNIQTRTITSSVISSDIEILSQNIKMNTYNLYGLKLTSIYGNISCRSLNTITDRSQLQINLGESLKTLLNNRIFTNCGVLSTVNEQTFSLYIDTTLSSVNYATMIPHVKNISIANDVEFVYYVQICILG